MIPHLKQNTSIRACAGQLYYHLKLQAGLYQVKDRHQWWGREFRCSLLLNMDKLFPKAIIYVLYH